MVKGSYLRPHGFSYACFGEAGEGVHWLTQGCTGISGHSRNKRHCWRDPDASKYPHSQATWDWATKAKNPYHSQSKYKQTLTLALLFSSWEWLLWLDFCLFLEWRNVLWFLKLSFKIYFLRKKKMVATSNTSLRELFYSVQTRKSWFLYVPSHMC